MDVCVNHDVNNKKGGNSLYTDPEYDKKVHKEKCAVYNIPWLHYGASVLFVGRGWKVLKCLTRK